MPPPDAAPKRPLPYALGLFALVLSCGLALCAVDLVSPFAPGTVGLEPARYLPGAPFTVTAGAVDGASPAARAGIRNDDVLRIAGPHAAFRLRTIKASEPLNVERVGSSVPAKPLTLVAAAAEHTAFAKQWAAMRIVFLILTGVLLGMRARERSVRALALFLLSIGLMCDWWTYPPPLAVAGLVLRAGSAAIGFPALVAFVVDLGRDTLPDALAQRIRSALPAVAAAYALLVAAANAALYAGDFYAPALDLAVGVLNGAFALTAVAVLALYAIRATEREQQKAIWIALSFGIAIAGGVTYLIAAHVAPGGTPWGNAGALLMIALPCGLAYAILHHRLLDVTFAIDQAVAYGAATFVLVLIFTGMDYVVKKQILDGRGDDRTLVNLVVAGSVLFVLRTAQTRVNQVIRAALFRKRMERLQTLRAFAKDVRFFLDAALLERDVVRKLDETFDGCGCAWYVREERRLVCTAGTRDTAEEIDMNDPAILRIQSTASCARTGEAGSNLRAAYAFPIIARGALSAVVLIGTDDSVRFYAPDEIEAIHDVVRAAGDTAHVLRAYESAPPRIAAIVAGSHVI